MTLFENDRPDLDDLRQQAASCRTCELFRNATRTVFGVGPASARLMLVGEQPGDREDVEGQPFVDDPAAMARVLAERVA
jgi:DNA polymerase